MRNQKDWSTDEFHVASRFSHRNCFRTRFETQPELNILSCVCGLFHPFIHTIGTIRDAFQVLVGDHSSTRVPPVHRQIRGTVLGPWKSSCGGTGLDLSSLQSRFVHTWSASWSQFRETGAIRFRVHGPPVKNLCDLVTPELPFSATNRPKMFCSTQRSDEPTAGKAHPALRRRNV